MVRVPIWRKSRFELVAGRMWRSQWLGYALLLAAAFLVVLWTFRIPPSGYSLVALAVAAALMGLRPEMGERERWLWALIVIAFAIVEVRAMRHDRQQQEAFQSSLKQSFAQIGDGIKASIADSDRNFNATIGRIQEGINTETGGNSFCYITIGSIWNSSGRIFVIQNGKFPLHGVQVRIVDLDKFDSLPTHFTLEQMSTAETNLAIGDMAKSSSRIMGRFNLPNDHLSLNIFFSAENGFWSETLRLKKVDGKWTQALQVSRQIRGSPHERTMFTHIDKNFPRIRGRVEW